jgi:hypothetical protein
MGLVYDPRGLPGVTTARPEVAGVLQALNYAGLSNPIGVPKSHHEGRLTGKGTIGKKAITPDPHLFHCAHFHMLQQMSIVSEYFDEHKEVLLRDSHARNES